MHIYLHCAVGEGKSFTSYFVLKKKSSQVKNYTRKSDQKVMPEIDRRNYFVRKKILIEKKTKNCQTAPIVGKSKFLPNKF